MQRPGEPPLGAGESSSVPGTAAIANAIFDATGVRFRAPPFTPEVVRAALNPSPTPSPSGGGRGWGHAGGRWWRRRAPIPTFPQREKEQADAPWPARGLGTASASSSAASASSPASSAGAPPSPPSPSAPPSTAKPPSSAAAPSPPSATAPSATPPPAARPTPAAARWTRPSAPSTPPTSRPTPTPAWAAGPSAPSSARCARASRATATTSTRPSPTPPSPRPATTTCRRSTPTSCRCPRCRRPRRSPQLKFPFGMRPLMAGWNALFHDPAALQPDPRQSAEWNRGAYLVNGLGHCGACHTPRNALGAEQGGSAYLSGAMVEGWEAPALTGLLEGGRALERRSLYRYLRNGHSPQHGIAGGPMAEVVRELAAVPDADIRAMAHLPRLLQCAASEAEASAQAQRAVATAAARQGQLLGPAQRMFDGACAACHHDGNGPTLLGVNMPLALNSNLHERAPRQPAAHHPRRRARAGLARHRLHARLPRRARRCADRRAGRLHARALRAAGAGVEGPAVGGRARARPRMNTG